MSEQVKVSNAGLNGVCDVLADELHAHEALKKQSQWQSIETAPRDGSDIFAIRAEKGFSKIPNIIYWCVGSEEWKDTRSHTAASHQPTHWMPLPEPPQ